MKTPLRSIPLVIGTLCLTACASQPLLHRPLPVAPPIQSTAFRGAMSSLVGSSWTPGNSIRTLNNGDQIFPSMLAAIRSARHTVNFETFVFEQGEIPGAFAAALEERARAGVRVRVILDGVGAAKSISYHRAMRDAGVDLVIYHAPWTLDPRRHNHRTHRKLLIVDGSVGFIGGVGIADYWKGHASNPKEWHDLHFRIEGPVVAQLQTVFQDNWLNSRHEPFLAVEDFPTLAPAGSVTASAFGSSPLRGRGSLELMDHLAIAAARKSLLIENAYFLPDHTMVDALCQAARRGVHVTLLLPGRHMDQKTVQRHSRKSWRPLLEAGVRLYEYDPTMVHTKLLIADGLLVSVGSGNLDSRSLRINDEANLNVLDANFAATQTQIFQADLQRSHPITLKGSEIIEAPQQTAEAPLDSQL